MDDCGKLKDLTTLLIVSDSGHMTLNLEDHITLLKVKIIFLQSLLPCNTKR